MIKAHGRFDNLGVIEDLIFNGIDKEIELIFICQSIDKLSD